MGTVHLIGACARKEGSSAKLSSANAAANRTPGTRRARATMRPSADQACRAGATTAGGETGSGSPKTNKGWALVEGFCDPATGS